MTREAIEKLNENQLDYCKTLSSFIATHKKSGKKENLERYTGMLRGYIECLHQMRVLNMVDAKAIYIFFYEEDRSE